MPRGLWLAPLVLTIVASALVGLRYGWIAAQITETEVITHYAHKYLSDHGPTAQLSDCVAVPGDAYSAVWIVVRCQPEGVLGGYAYHLNRIGVLAYGSTRPVSATAQEPLT